MKLALILVALAATACQNLDGFVFLGKPAPQNADLMATSIVPPDLREEEKGPIVAGDGTVVDAYLLSHRADDGTPVARHGIAILYAHGQDNNIATDVPRTDELWQLGYTVLAVDERGYGKTKGTPTMTGQFADARAARAWLEARFSPDTVGLYGRSLGTFIVVKLGAERATKAMVLESPPRSIAALIDNSLSVDTPAHWYVDADFDSGPLIAEFTGGLFIMHGAADDYVPPANGEALWQLAVHANPRAPFWLVPGADHDTVPCVSPVHSPIDNACTGGFSSAYEARVTAFYDAQLGVSG